MQQVKKTKDYTIFQKHSGRYAVRGNDKQWIHGDEKARILLDESLIPAPLTKAPAPEAPAEGEGAETAAEQAES